jgi:hypothetical protein
VTLGFGGMVDRLGGGITGMAHRPHDNDATP